MLEIRCIDLNTIQNDLFLILFKGLRLLMQQDYSRFILRSFIWPSAFGWNFTIDLAQDAWRC